MKKATKAAILAQVTKATIEGKATKEATVKTIEQIELLIQLAKIAAENATAANAMSDYTEIYNIIIAEIEKSPARSAWSKGVRKTAAELLDHFVTNNPDINPFDLTEKNLLNGAKDWWQFSYGGCWDIYDRDIATTFCTPSELKKTKYGELPPNSREEWLDVQGRGLFQAWLLIEETISKTKENFELIERDI